MENREIFKDRPVEEDTAILGEVYAHYDDIPVLVESWLWDGIAGSSCIVPLSSLEASGMSADDFVDLLKEKLQIEGPTTESKNAGFLFLNFNFRESDFADVIIKSFPKEDDGPSSEPEA